MKRRQSHVTHDLCSTQFAPPPRWNCTIIFKFDFELFSNFCSRNFFKIIRQLMRDGCQAQWVTMVVWKAVGVYCIVSHDVVASLVRYYPCFLPLHTDTGLSLGVGVERWWHVAIPPCLALPTFVPHFLRHHQIEIGRQPWSWVKLAQSH